MRLPLATRALWVVVGWSAPMLVAQGAPPTTPPVAVVDEIAGPMRRAPQDAEPLESVALRVLTVRRPGFVEVDRGTRDLVRPGDVVVLRPVGQAPVRGRVHRTEERSSLVELEDPARVVEVGVPGVVLVPSARFEEADDPAPFVPQGPRRPHAPWQNRDEAYEDDMPLLATVDVLRPSERTPRLVGRVYVTADAGRSSLDDRSDTLFRVGTDVEIENPFGRGGRVHFDAELNHRSTDVDGQVDERFSKGRLDRLSYSWGGTRWEPVRQEVGRFLQHGMPEFGVVDGWEWGRRLDDGSSFGFAVGAFPEPDIAMETGDDYQVSGYYRWVADDSERFAATAGFQKTWHHSDPDRDLLVAKVHVLPEDGWSVTASTWFDYYGDSDDVKGRGVELTEAHATATRRFDDGDGVTLAFTHRRFPEIDREEFVPVLAAQLADDRYDRLSARGWHALDDRVELQAEVGAWDDEDESGGDAELGLEVVDLFAPGSRSTASVWLAEGRFTSSRGARVSYGQPFERRAAGRWDVSYDLSQHDSEDFDSDFADIVQHRLAVSWVLRLADGWSATLGADALLWDDAEEDAERVHLHLSKSF